jgi:hypothetical protein
MTTPIKLQRLADPKRGTLCVAECGREIPFTVQRIFHIYGMPVGGERGHHAHRQQHQFLIAMQGAVEVTIQDRAGTEVHKLADPGHGLHIPPLTWVVFRALVPDAVVLVLASHLFDEADYIRDRAEFDALIRA